MTILAKLTAAALLVAALAGCTSPSNPEHGRWNPVLGPGCPVKDSPPPLPGQPRVTKYAAVWFVTQTVNATPESQQSIQVRVVGCPDEQDRTVPVACSITRETKIQFWCADEALLPGGETRGNFTLTISVPADTPDGQWPIDMDAPDYETERGSVWVIVKST